MTDPTWANGTDALEMLECLRGKASDRKLRLFACACCRSVWRLLTKRSREAVEMSERYADGLANLADLLASQGQQTGTRGASWNKVRLSPAPQAARSVLSAIGANSWDAAEETARRSMTLIQDRQSDLIRDIFGNPFHPVSIDASWLSWNDSTVVKIDRLTMKGPSAACRSLAMRSKNRVASTSTC